MLTRPASPPPMRTTRRPRAGEPGRRADQVRPRVHVRAEPGPAGRALIEAGCIRIFADKQPGKTVGRPELAACPDNLRAGGTLVVPSLDLLPRSLQDLITIVAGLRRRGTGFRSRHEALDTTTPGGRLAFCVFAALAEFIGTHRGGVRAVRRRDRAARPGGGAAGLGCRAPDARARAEPGGQHRVRGAEDRDLTHRRMPGYPAGTAAGRGTA